MFLIFGSLFTQSGSSSSKFYNRLGLFKSICVVTVLLAFSHRANATMGPCANFKPGDAVRIPVKGQPLPQSALVLGVEEGWVSFRVMGAGAAAGSRVSMACTVPSGRSQSVDEALARATAVGPSVDLVKAYMYAGQFPQGMALLVAGVPSSIPGTDANATLRISDTHLEVADWLTGLGRSDLAAQVLIQAERAIGGTTERQVWADLASGYHRAGAKAQAQAIFSQWERAIATERARRPARSYAEEQHLIETYIGLGRVGDVRRIAATLPVDSCGYPFKVDGFRLQAYLGQPHQALDAAKRCRDPERQLSAKTAVDQVALGLAESGNLPAAQALLLREQGIRVVSLHKSRRTDALAAARKYGNQQVQAGALAFSVALKSPNRLPPTRAGQISVGGGSTVAVDPTVPTSTEASSKGSIPEAACGPLSPARKAIVQDLLRAYRGNLHAVESVASHADRAVLAWAAYGGDDALSLARQRGWREHKSSRDGHFTIVSSLGGGDAVARLFVSDRGEAVLAFRGTTTGADWATNLGTVLPVYSDQLRSARTLAERARALYPQVTFVGHSLGGAMAQVARLHVDRAAVIFNSAAVGLHALGMALSGQPLNMRVTASLKAFRSPEDPVRGATQGLGDFEDLVVNNIVLTGNTLTQNALDAAAGTGYSHAMSVLARAMQEVRLVRDEGWLASETAIKLKRGQSACGFEFRNDGALRYQAMVMPNIFAMNRNSVDGNLPDSLLIHSQSPSGRFRRVQVCLIEFCDQALIDLPNNRFHRFAHGRYGAPYSTYWNSTERFGVVFYQEDGATQVQVIDTASMTMNSFPDWGGKSEGPHLEIEDTSMMWQGELSFSVMGGVCGSPAYGRCDHRPEFTNSPSFEALPLRHIQFKINQGREIQMRVLDSARPIAPRSQTRLEFAVERLNLVDAAGKSLIRSGLEALMSSLLSEQSINALMRLGLSREVVEANVLEALDNTAGGLSPTRLATDVAQSALIEAVASALEQAVFSRAPANTLPPSWQNPLRALVHASFAEGAGLGFAVSNPSPTAWVAAMVDRVYDAVEIHRGISGLRRDREVFLYSVALGAEVNAELITRFSGARSQSVLDQWRNDTRNNLPAMVGPGAVDAVSQVIDTGLAALTAQRRGNTAEVARQVQQLQQRAEQFNLPTLRGTRSPRDLVLNLVNAGDAASSLASVFLSGTALRDREQATSATTPPVGAVSTVPASVDEAMAGAQALGPSVDLVKAYMWLGQFDRGLQMLSTEVVFSTYISSPGIDINQHHTDAQVNVADWLTAQRRPDLSIQVLNEAERSVGATEWWRWAVIAKGYHRAGAARQAQDILGRWERAVAANRRADPLRQDVQALTETYVELGRMQDGRRIAATLQMDDCGFPFYMGGYRLQAQLGQHQQALTAARRCTDPTRQLVDDAVVGEVALGLAESGSFQTAQAILRQYRVDIAALHFSKAEHFGAAYARALFKGGRTSEARDIVARSAALLTARQSTNSCHEIYGHHEIKGVSDLINVGLTMELTEQNQRAAQLGRRYISRIGGTDRVGCTIDFVRFAQALLGMARQEASLGRTERGQALVNEADTLADSDRRIGQRVFAGTVALALAQRNPARLPARAAVADTAASGSTSTENTLNAYIQRFPEGQFLRPSERDPPGWFGGQCVAWARALFGLVASRSIDSLSGNAGQLPGNLRDMGFEVSENPAAPRVGAIVAWSDGGFGHVGVVTEVHRSPVSTQITEITVSEANWGAITEEGARRWGLSLAEARREFVTESYGTARSIRLPVNNLTRGSYRFSAYVYP